MIAEYIKLVYNSPPLEIRNRKNQKKRIYQIKIRRKKGIAGFPS